MLTAGKSNQGDKLKRNRERFEDRIRSPVFTCNPSFSVRRYEDLSSEAGWSDEVSSDKRCNGLFNQSPLAMSFYSFSEETQEVVSTLRDKS